MNNLKKYYNYDIGVLLIRLALAAVFIAHGWGKFSDMTGTVGFFSSLGINSLFAYLVAATELLGGVAMLLGIWTKWAGILLAIVMIGAIYFVKFAKGPMGYELELTLLLTALGVSMMDPGKYAVHKKK